MAGTPAAIHAAPRADAPTCTAEQTSTSPDGSGLRGTWQLCVRKNSVTFKATCQKKSLFGFWQDTSCAADGTVIVAKDGKVLPQYAKGCVITGDDLGGWAERFGFFPPTMLTSVGLVSHSLPCPAGQEAGRGFATHSSEGSIEDSLWFSCQGAGTYTATLKQGRLYTQTGSDASASAQVTAEAKLHEVSVSAPLC
ncbi:hypothetical protein ACIF6L_34485 [Kitasatospora sp. NPDC086009]|uniref:hypothetical protein n=1 Tax=unclassified Kitasatospora TaxID=2633591 RepID=UPI0037CBC524